MERYATSSSKQVVAWHAAEWREVVADSGLGTYFRDELALPNLIFVLLIFITQEQNITFIPVDFCLCL